MLIQLAQHRFSGLAICNAEILIYFQIKYTGAISLNSTQKLLWFEITKMLIAVYCVIYYNFLKTVVPYTLQLTSLADYIPR